MRDLISKLDAILLESTTLQDLKQHPAADDPQIQRAIADKEKQQKDNTDESMFEIGDAFGISFSEDHEISTEIVDILEDGIVIELDDTAMDMLTNEGLTFLEGELVEDKQKGVDGKACWKGYKRMGTKQKGGKTVDNCVKMEDHGPENPDAPVNYGEYDREGDMAKDDLRTIDDAAEELYSILQADDNLPEWVQSKITKAVDYLDTARDYMKAQKYEEGSIEEYGDTAKGQKMLTKVHKRAVDRMIKADDKRDANDAKKNQQSANRAWDRFSEKEKYGEGVAEGKKPDNYHIVNKDGKPASLASYADKDSAIKDRDEKYPGAEVRQVGPRGKVKGVAEGDVDEAKYQGREVPLGKKMAGDVKKSKVYVRKPNGNIVKVNFGDKKMRIKKSNPARRKSFRARHNCKNPGPRWKARYWSCRSW